MKIHGRTVQAVTVNGTETFGIVSAITREGVSVNFWGKGWEFALIPEAQLGAPVSGKPTEAMLEAKAQASTW